MKKNLINLCAGALVATAMTCQAGIIVEETFEGGIPGTWAVTFDNNGPGASTIQTEVGNASATAAGVEVTTAFSYRERIRTTDGNFLADYVTTPDNHTHWIMFDFYSYDAAAPSSVALFISATGGAGDAGWYYMLPVPSVAGWSTYRVDMSTLNGGDWTDLGTSPVDNYLATLSSMDQIGVMVLYNGTPEEQTYAIDNFRRGYSVPEPGTFAALGFAFASLGVTFRRRLNDAVSKLKARFSK